MPRSSAQPNLNALHCRTLCCPLPALCSVQTFRAAFAFSGLTRTPLLLPSCWPCSLLPAPMMLQMPALCLLHDCGLLVDLYLEYNLFIKNSSLRTSMPSHACGRHCRRPPCRSAAPQLPLTKLCEGEATAAARATHAAVQRPRCPSCIGSVSPAPRPCMRPCAGPGGWAARALAGGAPHASPRCSSGTEQYYLPNPINAHPAGPSSRGLSWCAAKQQYRQQAFTHQC